MAFVYILTHPSKCNTFYSDYEASFGELLPLRLKLEKNDYGDPIILVQNGCTQEKLNVAIKEITRSFFVYVPYGEGAFVKFLIDQGFVFYHGDNEKACLNRTSAFE